MKLGPAMAALAAGLLVGGGAVVVLALRKGQELQARGALLEHSLTQQGDSTATYLAALGGKVEDEVRRAAQAEARAYVGTELGFTQARIDSLLRVGARLGIT